MSTVDDVRKAFQDSLAPELRTISARLDALEKVMLAKFESVDTKFESVDTKFESVDTKLESLHKEIQGIDEKPDLDRRLTRLDSKQVATQ